MILPNPLCDLKPRQIAKAGCIVLALLPAVTGGCGSSAKRTPNADGGNRGSAPSLGADTTRDPDRTQSDVRPPAVIDGQPVAWDELRAALGEAAGGLVLEEIVLERRLRRELMRAGLELEPDEIEAERQLLAHSLAEAGADEDGASTTQRLIDQLRRSRGFGETRFNALLRRNAMMRRLVRDEVQITPALIDQAYALRYGPKYRTRVIITPTEREAAGALTRLQAKEPGLAERFAEVAADASTDESSLRGGLIEPFSPADPTYPETMRRAAAGTDVGQVSDAFALENGYGLLLMVERIPASEVRLPDVATELEREARLRQERLLMDRLGNRLLDEAKVTAFDPSLRWSWETRRGVRP